MRIKTIDAAVDLTVTADGSAVVLSSNLVPFIPNSTVIFALASADLDDSVVTIQGREDSVSAFADLTDVDGNVVNLGIPGTEFFEVVLPQESRVRVVEGTGVGTASVTLLGN